jgi:hypothetical protein
VTEADLPAFLQAFNRLAVGLRLPTAEIDAAMKRIYFDFLRDLPLAAVDAAVEPLGRVQGYGFPSTARWHEQAEQCRVEQTLRALPAGREEPWHFECNHCGDSGWEERTCNGEHRQCGRAMVHPAHSFVTACSCRATNATYGRHHRVPRGRETYAE